MATKKSGSKAKASGGPKAGKRNAKMATLKDMEAKGSQKIRGGGRAVGELQISRVVDKSSAILS